MLYERFNKPSNTTLIEELDSKSHQQPVTDKFIRNTHQVPSESGMMRYPQHVENFTLYEQSDSQLPPQQLGLSAPMVGPTCPEIYMHIMSCPVCRRMYGQETKPNMVYICIIFILLVFCALLFKKAFP